MPVCNSGEPFEALQDPYDQARRKRRRAGNGYGDNDDDGGDYDGDCGDCDGDDDDDDDDDYDEILRPDKSVKIQKKDYRQSTM